MTEFTPKDWKDLPNKTTRVTAAALEDLETRVTSTGGRTITEPTGVPLTLLDDQEAVGTLVLGNITSGQNPANTPGLVLQKDGTNRWLLGIDVQAGSQGDFALFSHTSSSDVIYITDEASPKVSIRGDRNSPGQFTIYGNPTNRTPLYIGATTGTTADLFKLEVGGVTDPIWAIASTGAQVIHTSTYNYGTGDAGNNRGIFYVNSDGALQYVSPYNSPGGSTKTQIAPLRTINGPIRLQGDADAAGGVQFTLANVTTNQPTYGTGPVMNFEVDGSNKWQIGIDATPGRSDLVLGYSYTGSVDLIYMTSEAHPTVGINGSPAVNADNQFTVAANKDRIMLAILGDPAQSKDLMQLYTSQGLSFPIFGVKYNGALYWSSGSVTPDVNLSRTADTGLRLGMNGDLVVVGAGITFGEGESTQSVAGDITGIGRLAFGTKDATATPRIYTVSDNIYMQAKSGKEVGFLDVSANSRVTANGTGVGFNNQTPSYPVLATGTGKTVDNVITVLQNLGLVKQS